MFKNTLSYVSSQTHTHKICVKNRMPFCGDHSGELNFRKMSAKIPRDTQLFIRECENKSYTSRLSAILASRKWRMFV